MYLCLNVLGVLCILILDAQAAPSSKRSVAAADSEPSVAELAQVARDIYNQSSIEQICNATNSNNSFIYCYGDLLAAVNVHKLFNDSKYFVDMPMKYSPNETDAEFGRRFGKKNLEEIDRSELLKFVNEYFSAPGTELIPCQLDDWKEFPPRLMRIRDPKLREFALKLNRIWKDLCRQINSTEDPDRHSLIKVPNPFIVPGGRFREFYYWDAYWILKGLAACGLNNTMKNMIGNLVHCVDTYGFIPNGGRVYYLDRSQPPMLIPMAYEYYELTHDLPFIMQIFQTLLKEYEFWNRYRMINVTLKNGETYPLYRYHADSTVPRPESFREDLIHAYPIQPPNRPKYYRDTASGAESGMDFSTRWFVNESIETIETTDVIPVDLNALICQNLNILSYFYLQMGYVKEAEIFNDKRFQLRYAMQQVFYNDAEGTWFDYNLRTGSQNVVYYASGAVPLYAECYQPLNLAKPDRTIEYLNRTGVFKYRGGIPMSLNESGQQWDFPNGWAPYNHMIIEGLRKSDDPFAQEEAFHIAQKWVSDNYHVFEETGYMWEKYNVYGAGASPGGGGEYDVQEGFGWSNGAVLDLMVTYYDRLTVDEEPTTTPKGALKMITISSGLLTLCFLLMLLH